ncbi:MAG: phosphoglycerate kinase [bacterium]
MNKLFIESVDLKGKKVLTRLDLNVPLDEKGNITNDKRIAASMPSVKRIIKQGGRAILMSHLGRPKGKIVPEMSLKPVAVRMAEILGKSVTMAPDCIGDKVEALVKEMKEGDVLLLENLRFHREETENDPEFAKELSRLGDIYINDAFGSAHRAHASTEGVTKYFDIRAAGYLMKKELDFLGTALDEPKHPFTAIIGGAKISGKIDVINALLEKVDTLIIGGGMAYTFYKAMGLEIGDSLLEADKIELAAALMKKAESRGLNLLLPDDCIIADSFNNEANTRIVDRDKIPAGWQGMDIGPISIGKFSNAIKKAKTVVWNGPMGVFEMSNFAKGTNAVAFALSEITAKGAVTVIGGGDSASAIKKAGLSDKVSHVSTGGGASLEYMEGKVLPGVAALSEKNDKVVIT